MYNRLIMLTAFIGTGMSAFFGGWNSEMTTLLIFMIVDYALGILTGVLGKSPKTKNGGLSSSYGWVGALKKVVSLVMIALAHRVDMITGGDLFKIAITTGYLVNELVSIVENAGILGIPMPEVVTQMIDVLKQKNVKNKKSYRRDDDGTMV